MKLSNTGDHEVNAMTQVTAHMTIPVLFLLRVIYSVKAPSGWWTNVVRHTPGCKLEEHTVYPELVEKGHRPLDPAPLCTAIPENPTREQVPQVCQAPAFAEIYARTARDSSRVDVGG